MAKNQSFHLIGKKKNATWFLSMISKHKKDCFQMIKWKGKLQLCLCVVGTGDGIYI